MKSLRFWFLIFFGYSKEKYFCNWVLCFIFRRFTIMNSCKVLRNDLVNPFAINFSFIIMRLAKQFSINIKILISLKNCLDFVTVHGIWKSFHSRLLAHILWHWLFVCKWIEIRCLHDKRGKCAQKMPWNCEHNFRFPYFLPILPKHYDTIWRCYTVECKLCKLTNSDNFFFILYGMTMKLPHLIVYTYGTT